VIGWRVVGGAGYDLYHRTRNRLERMCALIERTEIPRAPPARGPGLLPLFNMSYTVGSCTSSVESLQALARGDRPGRELHVTHRRLATCQRGMTRPK